MQFADGAVVDNLSFSSAKNDTDDKALFVLPVHTEAIGPLTGAMVSLDLLNFESANLPIIDAHNRQLYSGLAPELGRFLAQAKSQGTERAVLAFNLSGQDEQPLPALQGTTPGRTARYHQLAQDEDFTLLDAEQSRELVTGTLGPSDLTSRLASSIFDAYVDGFQEDDTFAEGVYRPGFREESGVLDVARASAAAILATTPEEFYARLFEKHPDWAPPQ